jgi:hypothetical protein
MLSAMERLRQAEGALRERASDPWKRALERHLPDNVTSISSVALLELLDPIDNRERKAFGEDDAFNGVDRAQIEASRAGRISRHDNSRMGSSIP